MKTGPPSLFSRSLIPVLFLAIAAVVAIAPSRVWADNASRGPQAAVDTSVDMASIQQTASNAVQLFAIDVVHRCSVIHHLDLAIGEVLKESQKAKTGCTWARMESATAPPSLHQGVALQLFERNANEVPAFIHNPSCWSTGKEGRHGVKPTQMFLG